MRVGLVCPYDLSRPGGVQQQVVDLGHLLAARVESVTVIGPGAEAVGDGPFRVVGLGRVRPIRANGSVVPLALGSDLGRQIREAALDLDVLHVHEPLMPMVGPAALTAGRPVVATFHALAPPWVSLIYRVGPPRWFRKRWFGKAVLTAVSTEAAKAPEALGSVSIIPNGVDTASYEGGAIKVSGRVAFLGRNEARKGLDVLLAAWPLVRARRADASLVVIGADGPGEVGDPIDGVDYRGRVSEGEKRQLLGESSIMAAPNLGGESFGLVLVEAMASSCAVVASDIPAFRAVVGDAGELVTPGDAAQLALAVTRLLSDPSATAALQLAGLERAREFDWSRVLPAYEACYRAALERQ